MRFMMIMIPNIPDEANWTPTAEAVAAMTKFNAELTKAGVLLSLDGLQPSSKGARVGFSGGRATVTDGSFTEAKEMIGGYWLIQEIEGRGGRMGDALPCGGRRRDRGSPGVRDVGLPAGGPGGGAVGAASAVSRKRIERPERLR
jgi:hypothetical protein